MRKYHYDLTYQGKTYLTVREAAKALGIKNGNLRYRLKASDLSLTKTMSKDWRRDKKPTIHRYGDRIFKSIFEISDEYGFAYHMLRRLLVNHSLEEIIDNKMILTKGSRRMSCHHLWVKRITSTINGYQCTICQETTKFVDASTGGELDFRDNATWYSFVDPIRRDYIIKKDEEEKLKRQDQLKKQKTGGK